MKTLIPAKMKSKVILIIALFFMGYDAYSQSEYIYRIRVKVNADACGLCNHWSIKDVYYGNTDDSRIKDIITSWNYYPYEVWQYYYVSIPANTERILRWNDPAEDNWVKWTFSPDISKTQTYNYHGTDGGSSWHSTWLNAEVETYDPVNITSITCGSETGYIQCIKNIKDNLNFNLSAVHSTTSAYINIKAYDEHDALIQNVYAGYYTPTKAIKFSDFNLQNYWEKQVKFVVTTEISNVVISSSTSWYVFTTPFPKPTAITPNPPHCFGDKNASVRLDFSTDDVSRYIFTLTKLIKKINPTDACVVNAAAGTTADEYQKDKSYCIGSDAATITGVSSNTFVVIDLANLVDIKGDNGLKNTFGAGAYQLTVVSNSSYSCIFDTLISIPETSELILSSANAINNYTSLDGTSFQIRGYGAKDTISIELSGGHTPYRYSINNGTDYTPTTSDTSYSYSGVAAGNYTVRITDAHDCKARDDKTIPVPMLQPDTISITSSFIDTVSCHVNNTGEHKNGAIQLHLKGGIGPYAITVSPTTGKNYSAAGNDFIIDNMLAGSYSLHFQDKYITDKDTLVNIPSHSQLGFNTITSADRHWPNCVGGLDGSLSVSGNGGKPYAGANEKYKFVIESTTDTVQSDIAQLTGLNALQPYNVVIKDQLGCQFTVSNIVIPQNPNPLKIILVDTIPPVCNTYDNGKASFTGINGLPFANGYDFSLTNISTHDNQEKPAFTAQFNDLVKGKYEITIKDQHDCVINDYYRDTIFISEPAPIDIKTSARQVSRKGLRNGQLQAVLSGGNKKYQYEWYNGLTAIIDSLIKSSTTIDSAFAANLGTGDYLLRVRDTCGCNNGGGDDAWLEWATHIGEPARSLSFVVKEHKNISCQGMNDGRIIVEGNGGWGNNYRYGLQPDKLTYDGEFNQLLAGLYTFYVVDETDEVFYDTIRITESQKLNASQALTLQPKCYGVNDGSFNLSINGGTLPYYVSIDNNLHRTQGTGISGLKAGLYNIQVTDFNQCNDTVQLTISQPDSLRVILDNLVQTRCGETSGAISVTCSGGTPGYSYQWMDNKNEMKGTTPSISGLAAGIYRLSFTDTNKCQAFSGWYTVSNSDGPEVTDTLITPVSCFGYSDGKAQISVDKGTPPYTYNWSNGQFAEVATGLQSTVYFVTITDQKKCSNSISVEIPSPAKLSVKTSIVNNPQCHDYSNGSISVRGVGGTAPYQYVWNNGNLGDSISNLKTGNYATTVTDSKGCIADFSAQLTNPEPVVIDLGGKTTICGGQTVTLNAGSFVSFNWNSDNGFTSQSQIVNLKQQGNYYLDVIDSNGCIGKDTFKIITSNSLLNADFLLKLEAFTGDTVVAVNISWPIPDSTYWMYDTKTISHFSAKDYENLIFTQPGTYQITLYAALGECRDNYAHEITIKANENLKSAESGKEAPLIQKFIVHPNPNSGNFTVDIDLRTESDINLCLFGNARLVDQKKIRGLSNYLVEYSLGLTPGIYILQLTAGNEQKQFKIVIY